MRRMWPAAAVLLVLVATLAAAWRARGAPRVLASVDLPARGATRMTFDPVLSRIYVDGGANFETELAVIDAVSLRIVTLPDGAGAIVDPLTQWYWTGNYGERSIVLRNGRTDSVLSRLTVPGCPHAFAIEGGWLWVAQQCDDHISVIDHRTRRVVRHIPIATLSRAEVGGAKGMGEIVINPVTRRAYFWKDMLPHRLDPATWTVRETPAFGGPVIAVNPALNRLYVKVHHGLRVLDGVTERTLAEVRLPSAPWSVTVGFAGTRVYAATPEAVVVLDGRSNDVVRVLRFPDGYQPNGVALDEMRNRAYVIGTLPAGRRVLRVLALDE